MASDSSDRDLLDEAHQRVRTAPKSAAAHLQLAIALIQQQSLDQATTHACIAAAHAASDSPQLEHLGIVLFQLGQFPLAYAALVQAARNGPLGAETFRMLVALFHRNGEVDNARRCIAASAQLETVVGPRHPLPDRPKVMRLRSVEKSYYGIKTDRETGLRYCWLKGGHLKLQDLIDSDRVNLYVATVFGDNLRNADGRLPDFDLFVNGVSCPDLDPGGLDHIEAFVTRFPDVPVLNPPHKVRRTTRAENARRLNALPGVHMPQTELLVLDRPAAAVAAQMEETGLGYPVIVRHRGTQTGKTLEKVDSRSALVTWLSAQSSGTVIYATDYVDCRWSDGYYHKTRAFFIDGRFFPVANLACDVWQVHSGDRYRVMSSTPSTQEEEKRYLQDPEAYLGAKGFRALHALRDTIDLDFFGIDFTLDQEGNVLVFEANAAMRHNFDHAETFPYTRPYLERISAAFANMVNQRANKRRPR